MDTDKLHEECGVFGIYEEEGSDVAKDIYYGLMALQHRGQESAGISVSDTSGPMGNVITKKGMGLVSEVITKNVLNELEGNIGVGHVRYSTSGESSIDNAQPIAMNYIKGSLALVHNGNIVNADELKEKQKYRGVAHYTSSDSEVLAYEIIGERVKTHSIEEAVKNAALRLRGGFACIVMSPRKLIAIRDPLGIKPLVLGKRGSSYILASESAAITTVGGKLIRDIKPGEIVSITREGIKSDESLCANKKAHCIFEYIYFARSDSVIDGIEVSQARKNAGIALARLDNVDADIVCGVPDSGLPAAEGYAEESGIPFAIAFYKNSYIGRSFIKPTKQERTAAVHMKLNVLKSVVKGKRIVLIDDSIVRGTTSRRLVQILRRAGAKEVHFRVSSPPVKFPCYLGIDTPSKGELISSTHELEEIRKEIGADSLAFISLEGMLKALGSNAFCRGCFSGDYPV